MTDLDRLWEELHDAVQAKQKLSPEELLKYLERLADEARYLQYRLDATDRRIEKVSTQ